MNIGERISELRKDRNIKQKDISKVLNVAISTVSNYETGSHEPDLTNLCKLADMLDVSTDYLLGRTNLTISINSLADSVGEDITKTDILKMMEDFSEEDREYLVRTIRLLYYQHHKKPQED